MERSKQLEDAMPVYWHPTVSRSRPSSNEPFLMKPSNAQSLDNGSRLAASNGYHLGKTSHALAISVAMAVTIYAGIGLLSVLGVAPQLHGAAKRYFLGHPVSIAATVMFCFALGTLIVKRLAVSSEISLISRIKDSQLLPTHSLAPSPADEWLGQNDAGHVAKQWIQTIQELPESVRHSKLVHRLEEVLLRQSQRGSAKQLPDDLRELSGRDADAAHDSLGMVRIIVWAIPMLGFLGTVIGITQTLGGLDFTNGATAVDNLKSGLYVAFDTTALGLVLSVLAIFLQFPVERSEQQLLETIDARIGSLVSSNMPSDDASDNQTTLIAELISGVQAAVAESLDNQSKLWRDTIDAAQGRWQEVHDHNSNQLAEAFQVSLVPALVKHSDALIKSQDRSDSLASIEKSLDENLRLLNQTTAAIDRAHQAQADRETETEETMADAVRILARAVDVLANRMTGDSPTLPSLVPSETDRMGRAA